MRASRSISRRSTRRTAGSPRVADVIVVEGAGGALVPIDARHDMLDIAARLRLPVLLVVGMRLGCLNHALLTAAAIRARGLRLADGSPMASIRRWTRGEANVDDLVRRLPAPLIADIAWGTTPAISPAMLEKLGLRLSL